MNTNDLTISLGLSWLENLVPGRGWKPSAVQATLLDLPDGILFVDTETTGLYTWAGHRPFLIGFASTTGKCVLVNTDASGTAHEGFDDDWVRELLENEKVLKVLHNGKFDLKHLRASGYHVRGPIIDTMLLTQLANTSLPSYALKRLAATQLGCVVLEEKELKSWLSKETRRRKAMQRKFDLPFVEPTYADVPRPLVTQYLRMDLEYTAKLLFWAGPRISSTSAGPARIEAALVPVITAMEERGVWCDAVYFGQMQVQAAEEMHQLAADVVRLAGMPLDVNSNKQLAKVLFEKLGLPCLKYTDKGNPCFDADTLPLYDHPVARSVLAHRKRQKLCTTYYGPLAEMSRATGGTIHSNFNLLGARRTGRMSSSDPNLQNIPRKDKTVRRGFTCRPGYSMLFADYSQIEMRMFAHVADDKGLMQAIVSGEDLHTRTAVAVFGAEAIGNESLRFIGKTLNFAIIYGAGARALRKQIKKHMMEELDAAGDAATETVRKLAGITESEARAILHKYHRACPSVKARMLTLERTFNRQGYIEDVFGRRYIVPASETRKLLNYECQGSAAGIMKRAVLRVSKALRKDELFKGMYLVNLIHDELVFEVPSVVREDTGRYQTILRNLKVLLEDHATFKLPVLVDFAESTTNWAEKQELALGE